jgi:hypothetical protein
VNPDHLEAKSSTYKKAAVPILLLLPITHPQTLSAAIICISETLAPCPRSPSSFYTMVAIKSLWTAVLLACVAVSEAKSCKKPFIRREWYVTLLPGGYRVLANCEQAFTQPG